MNNVRIRLWMAGMAISFAGWAQEPLLPPPPPPEAPMAEPVPVPASAPVPLPVASPAGWTLSFVWSPEYCKRNLGIKEPQCQQEHYFELFGLAPRFEGQEPDCQREAFPRELMSRAVETLPNEAQLRKSWRQHGACSGLAAAEYLVQLERASRRVSFPERFRGTPREGLELPKTEFKDALRRDNPELPAEALVLHCRREWLERVSVCVDGAFGFQRCPADVQENCPDTVRLRAVRPALRSDDESR